MRKTHGVVLVGCDIEITSRKQKELELKQSHQHYAAMTDTIPAAIIEYDGTGQVSYVNAYWSELSGRPTKDAIGLGWQSSVHPEDLAKMIEQMSKLREGQPNQQLVFDGQPARHVRPDGSINWFQAKVRIRYGADGKLLVATAVLTDINEKKQLEQRHERLSGIVEATSDFIGVFTPQRETLYLNKAAREFLPELTIPTDRPDLINAHPEWAQKIVVEEAIPAAVEYGSWSGETALRGKDGNDIPVSQVFIAHKTPDGSVEAFSTIIRDISNLKSSEERSKQLNDRLQKVLEWSSIGIWQLSFEDQTLTWDQQMLNIHGIKASDFRGIREDWTDRLHPDDFDRMVQAEQQLQAGKDDFSREYRIVRPNGEVRHIYANVYVVADGQGRPVSTVGINMDVTDQRQAELALQESKTQFQRVAERVPGMVFRYIVQPDGTHKVTYVSSGIRELLELEPEVVLDDGLSRIWERIQEDDHDRLRKQVAASAENLVPFHAEYRLNLPNKGARWVSTDSQPIRAENGDIIWDGVTLDQTERKTAELALQESKTQFQRMTENVPGMIFRYVQQPDGSHAMTYIDSRCNELFEVEPKAAIENADVLYARVHPEDLPRIQDLSRTSEETLQPKKIEFRVVLPGQGVKWLRSISQPSRSEDGVMVWDGVITDITERKQAELRLQLANEDLARATKLKDEFLANMSHELRTPLNAILGLSEGLKEGIFGPVSQEQKGSFDVIQQSGRHLLELINEILDLAKIESGSLEPEISAVNVPKLCESSLRLIKQQADKKKITLNLNAPLDLPTLAADEKRVRQILVNLLGNAVKFTPEGGKITVEVLRVAKSDLGQCDALRISVSDTGIGIAPNDLGSLFEPFVQVDSSLSRNYEGTGLGLALVKRFVELHSGQVSVSSQPGIGSCFTVELPYRQPLGIDSPTAGPPSHVGSDHPIAKPIRPKKLTVLLAEDNEFSAFATSKYLTTTGYQVTLVTNGLAAVEAVQESVPDIILMDVQMPIMDGLEAIERIRAMPGLDNLPIIALTGLAMQADADRCLSKGANKFLSKPYALSELIDSIQELVSNNAD